MASFYEETVLFDFYGVMLTENQQEVLRMHLHEDYSLSEIAELTHVSRQAVHDAITRSIRTLQDYENRLHMVEQWQHIQSAAGKMDRLIRLLRQAREDEREQYLNELAEQVTEIQHGV